MPLINENDTVATDEIRFGDNDRLAARVAAMISADTLVLLSDIDGLYSADPHSDPDARFLPEVREITAEIEAMAGEPRSAVGSGGMPTKIAAARIALGSGCRMVDRPRRAHLHPLAPHRWRRTLHLVPAGGDVRRRRASNGSPAPLKPAGTLVVDDGAVTALGRARACCRRAWSTSKAISAKAQRCLVRTRDGRTLGRGLAAYSVGRSAPDHRPQNQ